MTPTELKKDTPKQKLRRVYKIYKAGLITEDDLTKREKELLSKYYGIN